MCAVARTSIEWTDATWNPTTGCTKVSPGCAHCYAETIAHRGLGRFAPRGRRRRPFTDVQAHERALDEPLRWRKPRRVFVNSMSDLFHEAVPDAFIDRVFAVMALAPQHTFQILTKRAERMRAYFGHHEDEPKDLRDRIDDAAGEFGACHANLDDRWPLSNVWLGVSVENQHFADARIPLLLQTPAAVRFISAEPLLEAVDVDPYVWPACIATKEQHGADHGGGMWCDERCLDWVIVGGESGPGARPFDVAWARTIVAQCQAAGVPVFVKQFGAKPIETFDDGVQRYDVELRDRKGGDPSEWPEDLRVRQFP